MSSIRANLMDDTYIIMAKVPYKYLMDYLNLFICRELAHLSFFILDRTKVNTFSIAIVMLPLSLKIVSHASIKFSRDLSRIFSAIKE